MHFLHGLFVWTNIYEFMNMYGMRLDHTCYAIHAVTPQRPRNGPRMPKRVCLPRLHGTYVPPICSLFMVCSPFVHVLFVHGLFTVCSFFVPLIIVYKDFLPISKKNCLKSRAYKIYSLFLHFFCFWGLHLIHNVG